MKKKYLAFAFAAIIANGCHSGTTLSEKDPKDSSQKAEIASLRDTSKKAKQPIATSTNDFVTKAAIGGMMEVESSTAMIKSTENPDVQTLATVMVKDHSMANSELKRIANKLKIAIPQALPKEKTKVLAQLAPLQEDQKNQAYADLMVKEHNEAVTLFETASQNETGELQAFAAKHLPILQAHRAHALNVQHIMKSIKGDKGDKPLKISKSRQ